MLLFTAKYDRYPPSLLDFSIYSPFSKVKILRSMNFFYTEQVTTIGELNKYYTDNAIAAFEADGFIKIYE
jgi:hypothetical protein